MSRIKMLIWSVILICLVSVSVMASPSESAINNRYASHSVLSSGRWFKVGISQTGLYKLTYNDLKELGMNVTSLNPRDIRVYHNGGGVLNEMMNADRFDDLVEVPIYVSGESDGSFDANDYVLFYAQGPVTWDYNNVDNIYRHQPNAYENYSYAFITCDLGRGQRISSLPAPSSAATTTITEFLDYQVHDEDNYNIINGGRTYYGEIIDGNGTLLLNFNFKNVITHRPCFVDVNVAGRNFQPANFQISVNDQLVKTLQLESTQPGSDHTFAYETSAIVSAQVNGDNVKVLLRHNASSGTTSLGYVDFVAVNAWRSLRFTDSQMLFHNPEAFVEEKVYEYKVANASSSLQIWDVSNPVAPHIVNGQLNGSTYSFKVNGSHDNGFIAFNGSSYLNSKLIGQVENQDLHAAHNVDYLMVVYPDFLPQAERLKAIHAEYDPDLTIKIVTPQMIYNEFSCGAQDVTAIRDYCKMLYQDTRPLRYLLLFGDASFDYKNRLKVVNFVPSYEQVNASDIHSNIVTDDFFGFLGDNDGSIFNSTPKIGIGRLPVSTLQDATLMVDKIENYLAKNESTMQPWRNTITFVCDDAQSNEFFNHSEKYASLLPNVGGQNLVIDKIYLDAYTQENTPSGQLAPEVNAAINSRIDKGTLVLNYVGHGGEVQLAAERILQRVDVNSWRNAPRYPLMITGTCEFSRYDDHDRTSLGEYAFLQPYGGMIAMFTTARVTYGSDNEQFITAVYNHLFELQDGQRMRLGDVYRMAKQRGSYAERRYVFFGDPALRLPCPKWTVETTSFPDTLKALQPAHLTGTVNNLEGHVVNDFNGKVFVSVYDKATTYTTFGDEDTRPKEFQLRNSILFNGQAEVVNGHFSIDFTVPRDISFRYGNGMVSYYATDYEHDANGKYEDFIIGGFYEDAVIDDTPPTIHLTIDDDFFVNGGITSESPTLIAHVEDESGINTTGAGIGHDIVATLTGAYDASFVLNDYFVAEQNHQGIGTITYRIQSLPEGNYTLSLKVWDIYNNSSTATIDFTVTNSAMMALEDPISFPNPFTDETSFSFGHNQIGKNMQVEIQIYDVMGRLVNIIREQVKGTSARTNPIRWNGRTSDGKQLPAGLYVYRIFATNDEGETACITSKLIKTY